MKKIISSLILLTTLFSCVVENNGEGNKNFDRKGVLTNWIDNIILPAYKAFEVDILDLKLKETAFVTNPNANNLMELQKALFSAQKSWQYVAMFDLGTDPNATASYREFMNTFPVDRSTSVLPFRDSNEDDTSIIRNLEDYSYFIDKEGNETTENGIEAFTPTIRKSVVVDVNFINNINFNLSGTKDEQGFAAIDYLINHVNLNKYTTDVKKENYKTYLTKVVTRMVSLTTDVLNYWEFNAPRIKNDGGSTATSSFNEILNDYLFYVEQGFREAKIAESSGFRTGGASKDPMAVESFYSAQNSKILFLEAYKAVQNFYKGTSFDGTKTGAGITTVLESLNPVPVFDKVTQRDFTFNEFVTLKLSNIDEKVALLDDDFSKQVEVDNKKMEDTFLEIQNFVVFVKTNVFQTLGVSIDFADNDGD